MKIHRIKIVGQSGSGLLTAGTVTLKALQKLGFFVCADREFPSLIKGGASCFTINFSEDPIHSLSEKTDILVAIDKHGLMEYYKTLDKNGTLVHGYEKPQGITQVIKFTEDQNGQIISLPARTISYSHGNTIMMQNIILTGMLWKTIGFPEESIKEEFKQVFQKKSFYENIKKSLQESLEKTKITQNISIPKNKQETKLLDGNHAIALGAAQAGVKLFVAYPMSPATSILVHMANIAEKTDIIIKQAEDEITASQVALGSSFSGCRSFTATSGGGFDLMTETLSLAGINETPFVTVIAQRPGPGTGLPTWTGQGDLNLAIYGGHGEFARIVIGCADQKSSFENIQHAFNLSEKYQTPVIVLTEKSIAETTTSISPLKENYIPIERHLLSEETPRKRSDRYKITESGISNRWLPGTSEVIYYNNGDEHWESGEVTEDAEKVEKMYKKRLQKLKTIEKELPDPILYGEKNAKISFIGWGSSLTVMKDILKTHKEVNYLHINFVHPIKTEYLKNFIKENNNIHLIEGNGFGQLGALIEQKLGTVFKGKCLKYNGRQFFREDIENYLKNI